MSANEEVVGIVFPLLPGHVERFLDQRKTVFVKFFGREGSLPKKLVRGSRLFFYQSRGKREVVGEARIIEITSATERDVLARYGDRVFLTPHELEEYVRARKNRRLLVLEVQNPKRYVTPIQLSRPVTMGGLYMSRRMYDTLRPA